jgi:hypothetical protein
VDAVLRSHTDRVPVLARADLYADEAGFHLLELNISAALGGLDAATLNDAMLDHPGFADFATENDLGHVDTMVEVADMLLAESGVTEGRPVVAIVDHYQSFLDLEPVLRPRAARFARLGIDAVPCHLGQLSYRDGRVWVEGRPVDVIYRLFHLEHVLRPDVAELMEPVLRAVERGEVRIFTPIGSELYGSKAALALLSDERHRDRFSAVELDVVDRVLPWTRMVRPGPVTVDGETHDLLAYATSHREDLVLKATMLHGGSGFVAGWLTGPQEWQRQLREATGGPFVLQRRVVPEPEMIPGPGGEPHPFVAAWGAFRTARGYAGTFVRASADPAAAMVSWGSGAQTTCCFHEGARRTVPG